MALDTEFREKISDYLAGQVSLADLGDWISIETVDIDNEPPAVRQRAYDALRLISEVENSEWTTDELREQLGAMIGILTDEGGSALAETASPSGEQLLEKLASAEQDKPQTPESDDEKIAALMRYAGFGLMAAWSGTGRPNAPAFLHQPEGERKTPSQAPKEAVAS